MFSLLTLGATAYAASPPAPDACATYRYFPPFECFGRWAAEFLGAAFLIITGFILGIVGVVFNKLVEISVIDFATFYDPMKTAVELGWSTFRDVANIAIIGGFVFVAISMILGVEKFGARRFVVNILIAAVLINFSLFFTKMIVDVSNLFASQFAQAISTSTTSANISIGQVAEPVGIAEAFLSYLKISSVLDSYGALQQLGSNTQSGFQVLLAAFLGSVFFMLAALVLLYACVLLLVRTVMIIMLLLLSALAFGAYAVPTFSNWFDRWWKELVKHALFAPLLMLFLWATAGISRALGGSEGSLGSLVTSPDSSVSVGTVVNFFIIIGLLLASIKIANSFSAEGVKILPKFRAYAGTAGGYALAGGRGLRNLNRYVQSRDAYRRLHGAEGTRWQTVARDPNASEKEKAYARHRLKELDNVSRGKFATFGQQLFGKTITGFVNETRRAVTQGAGKDGYAKIDKTRQEDAQKELIQETKLAGQVNRAEEQKTFDRSYASELNKTGGANALIQQARALESQIKGVRMEAVTAETESIKTAKNAQAQALETQLGAVRQNIEVARKEAITVAKTSVKNLKETAQSKATDAIIASRTSSRPSAWLNKAREIVGVTPKPSPEHEASRLRGLLDEGKRKEGEDKNLRRLAEMIKSVSGDAGPAPATPARAAAPSSDAH